MKNPLLKKYFTDNPNIDIANSFGVYRILCKENGMMYIGRTEASFLNRFSSHGSELTGGHHQSKKLQNDWNKYGFEKFSFEVIEVVDVEGSTDELESYWMNKYPNRIYNSKITTYPSGEQLRQRILEYLKTHQVSIVPATIREVQKEFKMSSPTVADYHLDILEKRGNITRSKRFIKVNDGKETETLPH